MAEDNEELNYLSIEFTPTWVVATVCFIIISISLILERILFFIGKYLKRKNQKSLFEALQKLKEELMLMGFISLLLTVMQGTISKICIPRNLGRQMLPCSLTEKAKIDSSSFGHGGFRRLLSQTSYCASEHKVPFLSIEGLHHVHIFIFVLAVVHSMFSASTMIFGGIRIRQWKQWEDDVAKENYDTNQALKSRVTNVHEHDFIRHNFVGFGQRSSIIRWMLSFMKQFYGSVTKADYLTLRMGFIMTHCKGNRKFNFHKYMIRALEDDFKRVVCISWYLWVFVILFLLLDVHGWHAYFWIAFIPCLLLLTVGTKLEHVITELAHEVAEKHVAIEGDLVVKPSDEHFWFNRPQITLVLIHFILFQNAFEMAYIFWIWLLYGFNSCIMGQKRYIVPRLILGVIIEVLCSYSTLPLYAFVSQMGSNFKKAIFDEHVQAGILGWREMVKQKKQPNRAGIVFTTTRSPKMADDSMISGTPTRFQSLRLVHEEDDENKIRPGNT